MKLEYKVFDTYEHNRGGYSSVRKYENGLLVDVIEIYNDEMQGCGIAAAVQDLKQKGYTEKADT